jgi:hypothetical protein
MFVAIDVWSEMMWLKNEDAGHAVIGSIDETLKSLVAWSARKILFAYGVCSVTSPGKVIEIIPAHRHINDDVLLSTGRFPTIAVGAPINQGAGVFGIQGIGVSTPIAAAVAAATIGFAGDMQTPNGGMFTIGA